MSPTYWFRKIFIQVFFWEKFINLGEPKWSNLHWKNAKNFWRIPIWIPNGPHGLLCYYKSGKLLLQTWTTFIINWGGITTNRGRFFINRGSYYKSEDALQISAQRTSSSIRRIHKNIYKMIFLFIATIDKSHLSQDRSRKENLFILLQMNFYFLLTLGAVKKGFLFHPWKFTTKKTEPDLEEHSKFGKGYNLNILYSTNFK